MFPNLNAVAQISITGLAICRKATDQWQVLFLHPSSGVGLDHKLKIRINKILPNGTMSHIPINGNLTRRPKIRILLTNPRQPDSQEHRNNDLRDERDLSWIIDLNDYHPKMRLRNGENRKTTYLSIPHSKFYTKNRSEKIYTLTERVTLDQRIRRKVGFIIGAEIECTGDWQINVEIGGVDNILAKGAENARYEIDFDNSCETTECESDRDADFKYYYDFLTLAAGQNRFDLTEFAIAEDVETACNVVIGDPGCDLERFYDAGICS